MMNTGGLVTSESYSSIYWINEYPGASIFWGLCSQILGISLISFANYYPLYLIFILSILIYTISKKIAGNYALFAPVAYIAITFVQEYHLAPQAQALMLTTLLLVLLIIVFIKPLTKSNAISITFLIIVIWLAIVITHPATPINILISIIFICLMYLSLKLYMKLDLSLLKLKSSFLFLPTKKSYLWLKEISTRMELVQCLLALFGVIYIAYILYNADFMLVKIVSLTQSITNNQLYGSGEYVAENALVTQPASSYILAYKLRWAEIIGVLLLGLLS